MTTTTPTTPKTDRELWAEPQLEGGMFAFSLLMGGYSEDFADGMRGFAAAWFATYEDETDLPAWFHTAIEQANAIGLDTDDLPGQGDDDDEDES